MAFCGDLKRAIDSSNLVFFNKKIKIIQEKRI
jgi:hypothetical protein